MINLELAIQLAEEYGFEINKVEAGEGGMFYIDDNNKKVKVNDLDIDNGNDLNIKSSLNEYYKKYDKIEEIINFAA